MSGTYHRLVAVPRTVGEAIAKRLRDQEEERLAQLDVEGEARPAVTADPLPDAELPPADVSAMLLEAAERGPHAYAALRGWYGLRPNSDAARGDRARQVDGPVPLDARVAGYGGAVGL